MSIKSREKLASRLATALPGGRALTSRLPAAAWSAFPSAGAWAGPAAVDGQLSDPERRLLALLSAPTLPEALAESLGWSLGEVLSVVVELEVRGRVRSVVGRVEPRLVAGIR